MFALEINVDYSRDKFSYEILTMKNDEAFLCIRNKNIVKCKFEKMPSTPVFKTNTIFFDITPVFKNKKFYIIIKIKENFILKSFEDDIYNNVVMGIDYKKAKKWTIIAGKKIPFINTKSANGLNFYFINSPKIYIGTIDENGNPININNQSKDVVKYFEIKHAYERGKEVLEKIDKFVENFPNSVFVPDMEYLKIKILDKQNKPDEVINFAKKWIKKYAFNENLPKVLLMIAKNYTKLGFMTDASYFYQRIIMEYSNSEEAYFAMIYWADQMYITGESEKALKLYKKALYSTKNIDIASLAAMRLAQRYMDKGNIKTAFEYYKRVYLANKDFILKDKQKAFELAKTLASHQLYSLSIQIGQDLLKGLKKLDDLYEPIEYHLALWSYEAGNFEKANYWINEYLSKFPYGNYSDQLKELRDKVLFEVNDENITNRLKKIDKILTKYKGEEIAKKAFYKKIMLLYKLKKYEEILKLSDKIKKLDNKYMKNKKKFLQTVAKEYAIRLLSNNKCQKAVEIVKKYKITLDKKYDIPLYKCAVYSRNYDLASVICNKYLNSLDDKIFIEWIKRKINALEGLRDYKGVVVAVDDLCRVLKNNCFEWQLKKFFALWKLRRFKESIKTAKILEKTKDIRNCDAFIKIINYALENNDNLTATLYAKKIIDLQNKFKAYPYSPFVEFTYAKYSQNKKEAIKVLQNIIKKVKGENKARAYYMLANLTNEKKYINKCIDVNNSKLWKNLCKDALRLFE